MARSLLILLFPSITLQASNTYSQIKGNNPLIGNWRLQIVVDAGDTLYNASDEKVFENWFTAKMGSFKASTEPDTSAYTGMRALEKLLDEAKASFSSDGHVNYEVALDKNKKGTYRLDGAKLLLIKWSTNTEETKINYWVKDGIFCYHEEESPTQVYYFKKVDK